MELSPITKPIGLPFIELPTVDSTNNYAMGLIHAGMAQHGLVVFTHEQTKGKGQRNKQWLASRNENVMLSLILQPFPLKLTQAFGLSMAVAVGAHRFFSNYAGEETRIKWPNDIYWRDRKAGGILIENNIKGSEWKYAVVGIGLNINQTNFSQLSNKAVSLKQITGKSYPTVQLAKELVSCIESTVNELAESPESIQKRYTSALYRINEKVKLKKEQRIFEAEIKGVTPSGQLIAMHAVEDLFSVGEVEWVL